LSEDVSAWPQKGSADEVVNLPEQKTSSVFIALMHEDTFIKDFTQLHKLKRVTAYCLRFIHNCRKRPTERTFGPLSALELKRALNACIKLVQTVTFAREVSDLMKGSKLSSKSNIKDLNPIIDENDIIRVGGRLHKAPLTYEERHQIILPSHHHLTKLIIKAEHLRLLHAAPHLLIASLRQRFWIPRIHRSLNIAFIHA
jgi:hypothetical protein